MLRRLLDLGCDQITGLELIKCKTEDQDVFIGLLRQMGQTLTHLNMKYHASNVALRQIILSVCPQLTHLVYIINQDLRVHRKTYNQEPISTMTPLTMNDGREYSSNNNIVYLHFDAPMHKEDRLQPILQKCPELRYFIATSLDTYNLNSKHRFDNSDSFVYQYELASWCPNLIGFKSNGSYNQQISEETITRMTISKNNYDTRDHGEGLKHLSLCEDFGYDQIAPFLITNQHMLQHLEIIGSEYYGYHGFGWASLVQSLHLTQLCTLICDGIDLDSSTMITLLNHAPTLDTLKIKRIPLTLDRSNIRSIDMMQQLHSLHLHGITFSDEHVAITMLERFPALERLVIKKSTLSLKELGESSWYLMKQKKHLELCNIDWHVQENEGEEQQQQQPTVILRPEIFRGLALHGSNLEFVRIVNVPNITFEHLNAIASISTIKYLDVQLEETLGDENETDILDIVTKLKKTAIEYLSLRRICYLPSYGVLQALGELLVLNELHIEAPRIDLPAPNDQRDVDISSILPLLCSTSLKKITFENAIGRPPTNPRAVIDDLISVHSLPWDSQPCVISFDYSLYVADITLVRHC
ncbi:hypothetical protein BDB00DRAFT_832079 [Zychaea mexicana]|uniref:uncharacterized protein n=1 Tax=Zychaea mexicana TaxID=64656 RepID=UPI0022FEC5F9|nr:uncharacterized protein BDB00DRAFT_832079 [Zychaea mexicana]KAI9491585.1 hypothetical protein BDB00DRAFT_832079 [Zychaea mexicana]